MPTSQKPDPNRGAQWQRTVAREYYLKHPDASIADVARATGVSVRTVARCRLELVKEGHLAPGRNTPAYNVASAMNAASKIPASTEVLITDSRESEATNAPEDDPEASGTTTEQSTGVPDTPEQPIVPPTEAKRGPGRPRKDGGAILDDAAMRAMSGMLDELSDSEDTEATRRRMLKQTQRFVFDPTLHPDTRMSASTLWAKLVDMARAKDLGPGKPLTLADAIDRATDFCRAAGPTVMVPAFYKAFDLPDGDQTTASAQPQAVSAKQAALLTPEPPARAELAKTGLPSTPTSNDPNAASPW